MAFFQAAEREASPFSAELARLSLPVPVAARGSGGKKENLFPTKLFLRSLVTPPHPGPPPQRTKQSGRRRRREKGVNKSSIIARKKGSTAQASPRGKTLSYYALCLFMLIRRIPFRLLFPPSPGRSKLLPLPLLPLLCGVDLLAPFAKGDKKETAGPFVAFHNVATRSLAVLFSLLSAMRFVFGIELSYFV